MSSLIHFTAELLCGSKFFQNIIEYYTKANMKYLLPQKAITAYLLHIHAVNWRSGSKQIIETLAYFFGKKSEDKEVTVTHIYFPKQDDMGKCSFISKYNIFIYYIGHYLGIGIYFLNSYLINLQVLRDI